MVNTGTAFSANAHNAYGYNDRREVTGSERFLGTDLENPGSEVTAQRREYGFDTIGNRESHADGGGAAVSYTPDNLNQYSAIGSENPVYDDDGNLTDDGELEYIWDAENRLIEVKPAASPTSGDKRLTFTYDYMGRRVEKEVFEWTGSWTSAGVERFVYDEWNLLLVLDGANDNQVLEKYTWGLDIAEQASGLPRGGRPGAAAGGVGGLLAVEQVSGSNSGDYVYFYDANGNVAQVLDWDSETIAAHYEYDPFGRIVHSTGSYEDENRFRFSTKFFDPETELYYYGFRFYSPGQGRFLNRDPIEEQGGLNLYAFVGNDPVNRWDYLGLLLGYWPPGDSLADNIREAQGKTCCNEQEGYVRRIDVDVEVRPFLRRASPGAQQRARKALSTVKGFGQVKSTISLGAGLAKSAIATSSRVARALDAIGSEVNEFIANTDPGSNWLEEQLGLIQEALSANEGVAIWIGLEWEECEPERWVGKDKWHRCESAEQLQGGVAFGIAASNKSKIRSHIPGCIKEAVKTIGK